MKYFFISLFSFLAFSVSCQTFQVNKLHSLIYISQVGLIDLSNNYFDRKIMSVPTDSELNDLKKDEIFFLDRNFVFDLSKPMKDWSDYFIYLNIGSSLFIIYDEQIQDNFLVLSEIMITQSAIAKWTKTLTHRLRPFVYDDSVSDKKKKERNSSHSFFSMHSSTAFASATFGYYYYYRKFGNDYRIASLLFGSAAASSILRVTSGNHFLTDITVGAIVGSGVSYLICKYHQKRNFDFIFGFNEIYFVYRF